MRDHAHHVQLIQDGRQFRIQQQIDLPERDQTPILHGAGGEIGDSYHVLFRQRVIDIEVFLVEAEDLRTDVFGESDLVDGALSAPYPEGDVAVVFRGGFVDEVADCVRYEVCRSWYRCLESVPFPSRFTYSDER